MESTRIHFGRWLRVRACCIDSVRDFSFRAQTCLSRQGSGMQHTSALSPLYRRRGRRCCICSNGSQCGPLHISDVFGHTHTRTHTAQSKSNARHTPFHSILLCNTPAQAERVRDRHEIALFKPVPCAFFDCVFSSFYFFRHFRGDCQSEHKSLEKNISNAIHLVAFVVKICVNGPFVGEQ